jgi:hypothetical protein
MAPIAKSKSPPRITDIANEAFNVRARLITSRGRKMETRKL